MPDQERLEAFRRAAGLAHPRDPARADRLTEMERAFLDSQFATDPDQDFQLLIGLLKNTAAIEVAERLALRQPESEELIAIPDRHRRIWRRRRTRIIASPITTSEPSEGNLEKARTLHNERVRLNATFFNSLAAWFAGAGSAGALINTMLAASHNFIGAGEIG